ncbi:unnamed protein product [Adineta steineri]|uniref:Uncharacterized protein n=1 Tax=Adineta steineri TaxID=433720 RepID=A0A820C6Z9_9BILA|nr:unnamed protein product [Adineta steineri]CAF4203866.1 unnamed protein product [Adineta steineri]
MKVLILFAAFIFINFITLSNSSPYCQCQCCLHEPLNEDCQLNMVGNVPIDICTTNSTIICKDKCKEQYQTPCGQNNSIAEATCMSDSTTTNIPAVTSTTNGIRQCDCLCCPKAPCDTVNQGNVIVNEHEQGIGCYSL